MSVLPHHRVGRPIAGMAVLGLVGVGVSFAAYFADSAGFFRAYLFAWLFWLGISLGGMVLLMLHNLTGGEWGDSIRPVAAGSAALMPLMALLFIPIVLGMQDLYGWDGTQAGSELSLHRAPYLNHTFFLARAAFYFVIWIGFSIALCRRDGWHVRDAPARTRRTALNAVGMIVYLLTITHASVDWIMSRTPLFHSTMFAFIIGLGQTLSAFAFAIVVIALFHGRRGLSRQPTPGVRNDIGNVLLTLVILWGYTAFMQLLVVWMGNMHVDNGYFVQRQITQAGPWQWISLFLVLFHFFIPFFVLLFRATKRRAAMLATIAAVLLIAHLVQVYWLIAPSTEGPPAFHPHWVDMALPLSMGAIWLAAFFMIGPINSSDAAPLQMTGGDYASS